MNIQGSGPGGDETIVALATPPGRGALALVRVSGARALDVLRALTGRVSFAPRMATHVTLRHPRDGTALDDALVTWFPAPRSFTGDDTAELSVHGGHAVVHAVLAACVAAGARPAEPGEFTRRALLAGKVDLLQAEAIADLIDANTQAAHRVALAQLDGGLSRRLDALRSACLEVEALLAYDIDFPEEDDGPISPARIVAAVDTLVSSLDALLATVPAAALARDGAIVVLAGAPNAGKSALFNALSGEARALVTEVPGTTRDALEVTIDTPGVPLRLVDTAGLRETDDVVERLGIEVSARWLARAHVVLACGETPAAVLAVADAVRGVLPAARHDAPMVGVVTKVDATRDATFGATHDATSVATSDATPNATSNATRDATLQASGVVAWVETSAESGAGLAELLAVVQREMTARYGAITPEVPLLTRERHRVAVAEARAELDAFRAAWASGAGVPAVVAAVHVRAAVEALDVVIGAVSVDDVLDRLFASFCVGK
ncbi:MAG: tRNA uridine-5-carboxymethylaminomethyl(34) synthesis GTPase MnmE [Gemmatimonadaceae bacterium]|nr:tRNA uridine-5-carboxymethylaminomethyl(34) synthesis GTPase MnmE [Gemmatimonadaceae bacterium]